MSLDHHVPSESMPLVLRDAPGADRVLTPDALAFVAELQRRFGLNLHALMIARQRRQDRYDNGRLPDYLEDTKEIRQGVWQAAPVPKGLADRRVEITGPVDRKMMINALNSGARVFMADFEDATAPSFPNIVAGHANMLDYRDGSLAHDDPRTGKSYRVGEDPALLIVRPRGLHMDEANVLLAGHPVSAALFDFGLTLFHCGRALAATGRGPFYYLPKLESHREAAFWNSVFEFAQVRVGLPKGTIKATVLIETLPAAFEMDEIIWELRDHIAGLNCGRWDYIFSYIKTLRAHADYVLPDRAAVTMDEAFLATYAARLVKVCHRRGIHAMGGMAAQIPVKGDAAANEAAFAKVRADKQREVRLGHDGTWVAHPDLVQVAMQVFDAEMPGPNQIRKPRQEHRIAPEMLLVPHKGQITEAGVRANVSVAIEYLAQWLSGRGAVPIMNLMEDAATAEISRAQIWQWIRHGARVALTAGGDRKLDADWLGALVQQEIAAILDRLGPTGFHRGHYASAARLFQEAATADTLPDFITTPAYAVLNALD
ncbi:malate synthase A [Rhodovulum sulfidophilum]|uniref:malate synthase A n=1 Tax=Rhodovulum visakhapatnamense TaxID=364297 RepID=UPI000950F609|nr:malate synthase A [Rhodovulum visakhapatnamense]MBL3570027.1 malate synthase A [Rhodovulum visakhapatnamense]OLS42385.1 malate synthase A [Rhodovulum sulfidophilum]